MLSSAINLLRARNTHEDSKVSFVELFFDLVFVFAVTQLSHTLLADFSLRGTAHVTVLFMAVWWVWIFTSWVTNWLDPRLTTVRLMLYTLMFAGLLLSTSIPEAFGDRAMIFAGAYVFMQVGRSLFCCWALKRHHAGNYRNFLRISAWLAASGCLWIGGAAAGGEWRMALWVAALAIEYAGPALYFRTPGLGRSTAADWDIKGEHMAERCGLFIIIALGESVLVSGATFAHMASSAVNVAAFMTAFVGTVAMWWVYFNVGADRAAHKIATMDEPGRMARLAYTYIHIVLVAGIILTAVGDELLLAHPQGHADMGTACGIAGGPLLFLAGNLLFKRVAYGAYMRSHMAGIAALAGLAALHDHLSPLLLAAATAAILTAVAMWETIQHRRGVGIFTDAGT